MAALKLKTKYLPPDSLTPYEKNARTHPPEQIQQIVDSINEFGFTNPILIDSKGGIIAGHGRHVAALEMGLDEVPTIELTGLTDEQKRAYILADNKIALNSGWDEEMLLDELNALEGLDFDFRITGFDTDELDALALAALAEDEEDPASENHVPEPPEIPITKPGDVWLCGKHRVMCGDALSITDVETLMGEVKADLLLTDPPYNVAYEGGTDKKLTIKNDEMKDADFRQFLRDAYSSADTVMKPGASFYIFHADSEGFNFRAACKDVGWQIRQCLIWVKNSMVMGRQDYHWKHEPILYGWKDGAAHTWNSDRKQTTVLNFDRPMRSDVHPTMKPVALVQYLVANNSKRYGTVLDLFGGSGSTMIACEKTHRRAHTLELDPVYVDVMVKRYINYVGTDGNVFLSLGDGEKLHYEEVCEMRSKKKP